MSEPSTSNLYKKKSQYRLAKKWIAGFKCCEIGHYAKNCRIKQKIQELTINDDLKIQLER